MLGRWKFARSDFDDARPSAGLKPPVRRREGGQCDEPRRRAEPEGREDRAHDGDRDEPRASDDVTEGAERDFADGVGRDRDRRKTPELGLVVPEIARQERKRGVDVGSTKEERRVRDEESGDGDARPPTLHALISLRPETRSERWEAREAPCGARARTDARMRRGTRPLPVRTTS